MQQVARIRKAHDERRARGRERAEHYAEPTAGADAPGYAALRKGSGDSTPGYAEVHSRGAAGYEEVRGNQEPHEYAEPTSPGQYATVLPAAAVDKVTYGNAAEALGMDRSETLRMMDLVMTDKEFMSAQQAQMSQVEGSLFSEDDGARPRLRGRASDPDVCTSTNVMDRVAFFSNFTVV